VDAFGFARVLQQMYPQIPQPKTLNVSFPRPLSRGGRANDLTSMGDPLQTGRPVHLRSEEIPVPLVNSAAVEGHAYPRLDSLGPRLGTEGSLSSYRGDQGRIGVLKDGAEGVSHGLEDEPSAALDNCAKQLIMASQRYCHLRGAIPGWTSSLRRHKRQNWQPE
jgi:hypothetical protein